MARWSAGEGEHVPGLRNDTGAARPFRGADRRRVHKAPGAPSGFKREGLGLIEEPAVVDVTGQAAGLVEDGEGVAAARPMPKADARKGVGKPFSLETQKAQR